MRKFMMAFSLLFMACSPAYADGLAGTATSTSLAVTGPQEVGTTSMPAGNYLITEQTSGKAYSLMVSNKGTMILAPPPAAAVATTVVTPAVQPAAAAVAATPGAMGSSLMKNLVQQGMQKGMTQVIEKEATSTLKKYMK